MGKDHELVPGLGREAAAGHACHGRGVIVAEPNTHNILPREPHEPGIVEIRAGTRLAYYIGEIKLRRPAGSVLDYALQHGVQFFDSRLVEKPSRSRRIAVVRVEEVPLQGADFIDAIS